MLMTLLRNKENLSKSKEVKTGLYNLSDDWQILLRKPKLRKGCFIDDAESVYTTPKT
jgi:hypothetical protein